MKENIPTIFVVLGATGDLAKKKIFPSLFYLHKEGRLPDLFSIIGFSRREISNEDFREYVRGVLKDHSKVDDKDVDKYLSCISYKRGDFSDTHDYISLAKDMGQIDEKWSACSNKLFYLAVPPNHYEHIFNNLHESKLSEPCSDETGWTRVIVEKPFGYDLETAKDLDNKLNELFKEEQIYRVDHYLGKEMIQNILAFRFSNNIFEQSWSNKFIESIEIKLWEDKGVEDRGAFYDRVGALRDVGQNHLLQMLALMTMDNPMTFDEKGIRDARASILSTLIPTKENEMETNTFRAQYEGYRDIKDVDDESNVETYFKVKGYLDHPRWRGVPFYLESGKRIGEVNKEIVVNFKHPDLCMCPADKEQSAHGYKNKVVISIEPNEEIELHLFNKKPGFEMAVEEKVFKMPLRDKVSVHDQYIEEYKKLLLDSVNGDQTLFVKTSGVEAMWKFTDPIVCAWEENKIPLEMYKPDTMDAIEKSKDLGVTEEKIRKMDKRIGIIGLGKMGSNLALNLLGSGWEVYGYNRTEEKARELEKHGLKVFKTVEDLVRNLPNPKVVWVMLPSGPPLDEMMRKLSKLMCDNDTVIDGGNTQYKMDKKYADLLEKSGITHVDVGVSGGPSGARNGACLMVGGKKSDYERLMPLYIDLSVESGHEHFEGVGAGHFVKMVHNAIEYGMMQSVAEGFEIMKSSDYKLHLSKVARVYNNGSVIESRLVDWMRQGFEIFGEELKEVSGSAGSGGSAGMKNSEAKWTLDYAEGVGIDASVMDASVKARIESQEKPNFQGKVVNTLRNRFGGHSIKGD